RRIGLAAVAVGLRVDPLVTAFDVTRLLAAAFFLAVALGSAAAFATFFLAVALGWGAACARASAAPRTATGFFLAAAFAFGLAAAFADMLRLAGFDGAGRLPLAVVFGFFRVVAIVTYPNGSRRGGHLAACGRPLRPPDCFKGIEFPLRFSPNYRADHR